MKDMRLTQWAFAVVLGLSVVATAGAAPQGAQTGPRATANAADEATAITQFEAAITSYMAMRQRLRDEITGPVPNSTATELTRASDSLAAGIQRARAGAKPGTIFTGPIADVVKRRVDDVVRRDHLESVLANIDDEVPTVKTPSIHLRFPAASQMATMPPSLLAALPPLPKDLEYRIIGTYLVLRDVDAALIIDYIPAAVARKP